MRESTDAATKSLGSDEICLEEVGECLSCSSEEDGIMNNINAALLDSPFAQLTQSLRREANLPQYMSLDTASDALHVSSSSSSPGRTSLSSEHLPRLCLAESDINFGSDRKSSLREDIGHAAAETFLLTKLSFTLLKFLGVGYRWLSKLGALACYAMFLMPGFVQVGYSYFFDKRIHRSITYGSKPRNRLDLYFPEDMDSPKPVVAFVTGGAWIIGYKAWGSLLGLQLVERNIIVACIDYRNFPQGTVADMIEDVTEGLSFICNSAESFGGDPDRLYVGGQSAGAHLAACALVEQAIKEISVPPKSGSGGIIGKDNLHLTWRACQFKAYFAISGGYNLENLVDHFHNRGLYRGLFLSIMEGEESLSRYSPEIRVQSLAGFARLLLPPFHLFHGSADYSIPCDASTSFATVLASMEVNVITRIYEGKTHTDLFLQDPMRGGHDALLEDIIAVVHAGNEEAQAKDALLKPRRRLVPEFLLQMARSVSPF